MRKQDSKRGHKNRERRGKFGGQRGSEGQEGDLREKASDRVVTRESPWGGGENSLPGEKTNRIIKVKKKKKIN